MFSNAEAILYTLFFPPKIFWCVKIFSVFQYTTYNYCWIVHSCVVVIVRSQSSRWAYAYIRTLCITVWERRWHMASVCVCVFFLLTLRLVFMNVLNAQRAYVVLFSCSAASAAGNYDCICSLHKRLSLSYGCCAIRDIYSSDCLLSEYVCSMYGWNCAYSGHVYYDIWIVNVFVLFWINSFDDICFNHHLFLSMYALKLDPILFSMCAWLLFRAFSVLNVSNPRKIFVQIVQQFCDYIQRIFFCSYIVGFASIFECSSIHKISTARCFNTFSHERMKYYI